LKAESSRSLGDIPNPVGPDVHGGTVRQVTLPHESHDYAARKSILHVIAKMLNWCNTHLRKFESSSP